MISLKFVRYYQITNTFSLEGLLAVCKENRLVAELGELQIRSYGFCPNVEPSLLQTPNRLPYLIGRFGGKIRTVPRELIQRKVAAEIRRREASGEGMTKETQKELETLFDKELSSQLEPDYIEGYVIVTESGDLLITSNKKSHLESLSLGLQFLFSAKDLAFKPKSLPLSKSLLKQMAQRHNQLSNSVLEVTCKQDRTTIHLVPRDSEQAFFNKTLKNCVVERLTLHQNKMLFVTITNKGLINDIKFGSEFESEWREYGDSEASALLDSIRAGLWLDHMTALMVGVQIDLDAINSSGGAVEIEDEDEAQPANDRITGAVNSDTPPGDNVVRLFK